MTDKITAENVYKIFGPEPDRALEMSREGAGKDEVFRETKSVVAVNDVSFKVPEGQIFVVMGLSGSGKSTLIRCLNRLFEPTAGKIYIDDFDVTAADEEELRKVRLARMAMVFQHFALFPHKTVWENAAYGLKIRNVDMSERREQALSALKSVGLDAWADSYPKNLSGGMQQRVGLARALTNDAPILLMDEAFSALDPLIRADMQTILLKLQEEIEKTVVFITHDLDEALRLGDRIVVLRDGEVVQQGTGQEIVLQPADDYIMRFVRHVNRGRMIKIESIMDTASVPAGGDGLEMRCGTLLEQAAAKLVPSGKSKLVVTDECGSPIGTLSLDRLMSVMVSDGSETVPA